MTKATQFVHLQVFSEFSIEKSLLTVDAIIDQAQQSNMSAVALTDINNLFALVKFYRAAVKKGIKPIVGAEVDVVSQKNSKDVPNAKDTTRNEVVHYKLVLLCQNKAGFLHLTQLITEAYLVGQRHGRPS